MITYPMKLIKIQNSNSPAVEITAKYCDSYSDKLMGLMFKKSIDPDYGIILAESSESKINSSIHMFFMNFDITVLWLNKDRVIVDKVIARKWNPAYVPSKPAQYTIELHECRYEDFSIGDQLVFINEK